jgi:hypothetical protein
MHWWYYPDSYDELVVPDDAPEVVEPDKQAEGTFLAATSHVESTVS